MSIRDPENIRPRLKLKLPKSSDNKAKIRKYLLKKWSEEQAGKKFLYFVEKLSLRQNKRIYLERPARKNRGCDFIIYIENELGLLYKKGTDQPPEHGFLLDLIESRKANLTKTNCKKFFTSIKRVYKCEDISIKEFEDSDHELILKLSKWFFIEQDITYWNYSGRTMLWNEIVNKCFPEKRRDEH